MSSDDLPDEVETAVVQVMTFLIENEQAALAVPATSCGASTPTDEPDWSLASFLLSVLGEGTFLSLLSILERSAPDPVTARIAHLALQDEARHVAFGLGHLTEEMAADAGLRDRLRGAIERSTTPWPRPPAWPQTDDALVVPAASSWDPPAIARGWDRVQALQADMDEGRRHRLVRLGFTPAKPPNCPPSTRNFM